MTQNKEWKKIKQKGSKHYMKGSIEPIDLMKSQGILWSFAVGNIIKYACRNTCYASRKTIEDMDKIIHYCEMIKAMVNELEGWLE